MTFDDGLVEICTVVNLNNPGDIPKKGLRRGEEFYFHEESVGITRYYEAIRANQMIERVIAVYRAPINVNQIAVFEDGSQYIIRMVQQTVDENGIKISRLSLERNGEEYAFS
mgnify:CR=1 FL=1